MSIDPFILTTLAFGLAAIMLWLRADRYFVRSQSWERRYRLEESACWTARSELFQLKWEEGERAKQRSEVARLGGKARGAQRRLDQAARASTTKTAIVNASLRPRDEVVAGVLTDRAKRKITAGVAAQRP